MVMFQLILPGLELRINKNIRKGIRIHTNILICVCFVFVKFVALVYSQRNL